MMLHPATIIRTNEGKKSMFHALIGMKVDTPDGMCNITNLKEYKPGRTFRVILSNDIELYVSPMTKFYTADSHVIYAKDLNEGDMVLAKDGLLEVVEIWDVIESNYIKYVSMKTDALFSNYYVYDSVVVG